MVSKVNYFKCDVCGTAYEDKDEAVDCENIHVSSDKLKISNMFYCGCEREYPYAVIIDDDSGHGGLYTLQTEGSIEGVYEAYDRIKKYPPTEDDYD